MPDLDSDRDTYHRFAHSDRDAHRDPDPDTHGHRHPDSHCDADCDGYPDGDRHTHRDRDAHADAHTHTHADVDCALHRQRRRDDNGPPDEAHVGEERHGRGQPAQRGQHLQMERDGLGSRRDRVHAVPSHALNTPPCFAGHCNWRLPAEDGRNSPFTGPKELETILLAPSPCGTSPCIDPIFGPTAASDYWSATTVVGNTFSAWAVSFSHGGVVNALKIKLTSVRAVRTIPGGSSREAVENAK